MAIQTMSFLENVAAQFFANLITEIFKTLPIQYVLRGALKNLQALVSWFSKSAIYIVLLILLIIMQLFIFAISMDLLVNLIAFSHLAVWGYYVHRRSRQTSRKLTYSAKEIQVKWKSSISDDPTLKEKGIELTPYHTTHNYLTNCEFPDFVNGTIDCEIYLEPGSLVNHWC
jgi:hypothetical protein